MPRRSPPTFLTLPLELRLEIYTHLLTLPPPVPPEIQPTTYRCAYSSSPPSSSSSSSSSPSSPHQTTPEKPRLHPQILLVNAQTHAEALPILYGQNTFAAHPALLTAHPTLYHPFCKPCGGQGPRGEAVGRIRRWRIRVRLDVPVTFPAAAAASTALTLPPSAASSPSLPGPSSFPSPSSSSSSSIPSSPSSSSTSSPPTPPTPTTTTTTTTNENPIAKAFTNADSLTLDLWTSTFMGGVGADALRPFESVRGVRKVRIGGMTAGFERYLEWLRARMMMPLGEGVGVDGEEEEYVPGDEAEGRRLAGWR